MKPSSRSFSILSIVAWVFFFAGTVWRWYFITSWHDPRKYIYSDMKMYVDLAKRISPPGYVVKMSDVTHPPGMTWIVEYFFRHEPTFQTLVYFTFLVCALVPLAVGALGWVSFGRRCGEVCMTVASAYYTFVDFGGYFLAEIHIALAATLSITAYLYAMKLAALPPSSRRTIGFVVTAVVGGLLFSWAMALKMVAMPAIGGFCILHFLFGTAPKRLTRAVVLGIFLVAALPLTGVVAARCTKANDGQFCSGSNKSAADFLLGHYGRIQAIEWHDPKTHGVMGFGSPSSYQHGYHEKEIVQFAITDQKRNRDAALTWTKKNFGQAIVLSVEHVWDCFATYPWPANATGTWPASAASNYIFLFLIIFPAIVVLSDTFRQRGVVGFLRSTELLIASPLVGVLLAVFMATGEARYRIPWDGFFIVLGVEFYRRIKLRFREMPEPIAVADADAAPPKREGLAVTEAEGAPVPSVTTEEIASTADVPVSAKDVERDEDSEA